MPIPIGVLAQAGAGGGGATGSFDLLETTVLGTSASSVTFSNLENYSNYKHLQIRAVVKNTSASEQVRIQMNGVTSTSYSFQNLRGTGSAVASAAFTTRAFIELGQISADANVFSPIVMDVLDFSNINKNKSVRISQATHTEVRFAAGLFINTAAITSITYLLSGNTYDVGSRFSLYGWK